MFPRPVKRSLSQALPQIYPLVCSVPACCYLLISCRPRSSGIHPPTSPPFIPKRYLRAPQKSRIRSRTKRLIETMIILQGCLGTISKEARPEAWLFQAAGWHFHSEDCPRPEHVSAPDSPGREPEEILGHLRPSARRTILDFGERLIWREIGLERD